MIEDWRSENHTRNIKYLKLKGSIKYFQSIPEDSFNHFKNKKIYYCIPPAEGEVLGLVVSSKHNLTIWFLQVIASDSIIISTETYKIQCIMRIISNELISPV